MQLAHRALSPSRHLACFLGLFCCQSVAASIFDDYFAHGANAMEQLAFAMAPAATRWHTNSTRPGLASGLQRLQPAEKAIPRRWLLLTYPNSGTSVTMALGQCLQSFPMCTEYCTEIQGAACPRSDKAGCEGCEHPELVEQCGFGAMRHTTFRSRRSMLHTSSRRTELNMEVIQLMDVLHLNWPPISSGALDRAMPHLCTA